MARVLFVSRQDAGRSRLGAALFDAATGGAHEVRTAGTQPAGRVHPQVAAVLARQGLRVPADVPHRLTGDDEEWADVLVAMGVTTPKPPGGRVVLWSDLEDPGTQSMAYA